MRIFLVIFLSLLSAQQSSACALFNLKGTGECGEVQVDADLSACQDAVLGKPKVVCKDDVADVTVRGNLSIYKFKMNRTGGVWGGIWAAGPVVKTDVKNRAGSKALDKTSKQGAIDAKEGVARGQLFPTVAASSGKTVAGALQLSAHLDMYFNVNANQPQTIQEGGTTQMPNPRNNLRYYEWYDRQVGLNLVELTMKYTRKETSFLVDFDFGQFADINAQSVTSTRSGGPSSAKADEVSKHIGQAVLTYQPSALPGLVFDIGKLPTHVGLELMKAKDNWNYSRSTTFSYGGPFWHTGIHVGYAPTNQWAISGYVYNGWNTIYDVNNATTVGAQLKWSPNERFTWIYNYIGGPEKMGNVDAAKVVHESNLVWIVADNVSLAASVLYGFEQSSVASGTAEWMGKEFVLKWNFSSAHYLAPRFEIYRDMHGYTLGGGPQKLYSYTLTHGLNLSEGLDLRIEARYDHSTQADRFTGRNGSVKGDQVTGLIGLLYTL